jgi:hypothetical protein
VIDPNRDPDELRQLFGDGLLASVAMDRPPWSHVCASSSTPIEIASRTPRRRYNNATTEATP